MLSKVETWKRIRSSEDFNCLPIPSTAADKSPQFNFFGRGSGSSVNKPGDMIYDEHGNPSQVFTSDKIWVPIGPPEEDPFKDPPAVRKARDDVMKALEGKTFDNITLEDAAILLARLHPKIAKGEIKRILTESGRRFKK